MGYINVATYSLKYNFKKLKFVLNNKNFNSLFAEKPEMKMNSLQKQNHGSYLIRQMWVPW